MSFLNKWKQNMDLKYKVIIYDSAQKDLEGIFKYISSTLDNSFAATNIINELYNAIKNLVSFPFSYPLVDNDKVKDKTFRKLVVKKYNIFYRVVGNEVQIMYIFSSSRDYTKLI